MSLNSLSQELKGSNFTSKGHAEASALILKIKIELTKAGLMVPSPSANKDDLEAARSLLEQAVLTAIHTRDEQEFYRLVAQIRPFYSKALNLPQSANENKILALYLLGLVSRNEIAEFHTGLEGLEVNPDDDVYLSYPVRLERWLMEGSYNKVWHSITEDSELPSPEFKILADNLRAAVRSEIAACTETAYESLPLPNARTLLFFKSDKEIVEFVKTKPGWVIKDNSIQFNSSDDTQMEQDSLINERDEPLRNTIASALKYSHDIEAII